MFSYRRSSDIHMDIFFYDCNIIVLKCQYIQIDILGVFMAYYKRLRDLREDNGYTQKEIADFLFTTQPQYYRYESGLRDLPCELIIMLAKFYNVSTDYILGLSDKPTKLI